MGSPLAVCADGPFHVDLRALSDAAILVDERGGILRVSPAFEVLSGWTERELAGRPLNDLLVATEGAESDRAKAEETSSAASARLTAGPHRLHRRNGAIVRIRATCLPLQGEGRREQGCITILHSNFDRADHAGGLQELLACMAGPAAADNVDLSAFLDLASRYFGCELGILPMPCDDASSGAGRCEERSCTPYEQAPAPLLPSIDASERPSDTVDDFQRFAAIASHDLQEPLRRIIAYCDILKEDHGSELSEKAAEVAEVIQSGGRRLKLMINDLLAYIRVREQLEFGFEPVDMSAVLCHAMDEMQDEIDDSGVQINAAHLPLVWGRAILMTMVFRHLLSNAIKFAGERSPVITIAAEDVGDAWQFAVADRGMGIEPRFAERVFEIFQRLHGKDEGEGSGAGLAICKLIIERCGGDIRLDRSYDSGARFLFTLPKNQPEALAQARR